MQTTNEKMVPIEEKTFQSKRQKFKFFQKKLEFREYSEDFLKDPKKILASSVIGLFLLWSTVYSIFYSSYFAITNIQVWRLDWISNLELTYKAIEPYYWKSIFLTSWNWIIENIKSYQENIKKVNISRLYPNSLVVNVESYKPIFNVEISYSEWKTKTYIMLENGSLINGNNPVSLPLIKVFYTTDNVPSRYSYKKLYSDKIVKAIYETYLELSSKYKSLEISDMQFYVTEREFHVYTNKGLLIVDLLQDTKAQLKKYSYFTNEYKGPKTVYVDLRIKDRIDYCTVDTEYQCMINLKSWYLYE